MAALPPYKACEASALFTRSVAYLYTLCVYRQGSVPTLWEMPRSGALLRGLQNLETPLHAQRATPTGANFLLVRKFPKGKRIVTFCGVQKVTQKARGVPPCDPGSKLYGKIFFVTFPAFVSTPVCGATRFFGCFEPVRKGCCSTDARPLLCENGLLYCKLTGANVFEESSCSLSWLRWEFEILVC